MSEWIKPKKEDIELSKDKNTIECYVLTNNFGNVYLDIPIEYIKEILNENN